MEKIPLLKGSYRDILKNKDGHVIYDGGWVSNMIVATCRKLLAGFMIRDPSSGIEYLAVGRGDESWDAEGAPDAPDPTMEMPDLKHKFTPPIFFQDLTVFYIDEYGTESVGPEKQLQITATLGPGYPTPEAPLSTYPLREFGLFGTFDGEPYMINYKSHPVIHKHESATLIREIRLYF
ncbi:MAG: hypothetical protein ACMUJM_18615 [bacterium]